MTATIFKKRTNFELARGINAISANSLAKTNGRVFAHSAASGKVHTQVLPTRTARSWYPTDYIPKPLPSAKTKRNSVKTAKLRKSITPGTILILLSGRFRGKRVVFLKQLPSGTLLINGPYKVNGVPLRRVNQAFVIATSTRIDLSDVKLPNIDDKYFTKEKSTKKSSREQQFFKAQQTSVCIFIQKSKPGFLKCALDRKRHSSWIADNNAVLQNSPLISDQRKNDQKAVDALLMKKLANEPYLRAYLNAKFTLTKNDRVHDMRF